MKIAMVFDGLQIGGIERGGTDYANILCALGHEVTIVNHTQVLKRFFF